MEIVVVLGLIFIVIILPFLVRRTTKGMSGFAGRSVGDYRRRISKRDTAPAPGQLPRSQQPVQVRTPLGIALSRVEDALSSPDAGRFNFSRISMVHPEYGLQHGGFSASGKESVFTFGDPSSLYGIEAFISADMKHRESGLQAIDALLSVVMPEWEYGPTWIRNNLRPMRSFSNGVPTSYGETEVTLIYHGDYDPPIYAIRFFGLVTIQGV